MFRSIIDCTIMILPKIDQALQLKMSISAQTSPMNPRVGCSGSLVCPAQARVQSANDCGVDCAPQDARPSFLTAISSGAQSQRILATRLKTGDGRRCEMAGYVSFYPRKGLMSSAQPFRCFTKCSGGTVSTFPDILRSIFGSQWPKSSGATRSEYMHALASERSLTS